MYNFILEILEKYYSSVNDPLYQKYRFDAFFSLELS